MSQTGKGSRTGRALIEQINRTEVPADGIAMWHLGQEGMAVKRGGRILYFDPFLSAELGGDMRRNFPPPLKPEEVTNADYVLISHDHLDHLDPYTLNGIGKSSPNARFICPAPHTARLTEIGISEDRIIAAKVTEAIELEGIRIQPVACKHEEYFTDESGHHGFLGYILDMDGLVFYHAGDGLAVPELVEELKKHPIEIACLPINGHDFKRFGQNLMGNMTFREAADLADAVGAELVIPMHYDLFAANTENPAYFVDYLHRAYPFQRFKMFVPGERMLYLSERLPR
ncbi:MBL fold metallo-hydrolase [Paenibacillus aurantius]|uniref:MBL fold metallo-hydrolase n=1 Tax=Paenibacillus aurantius TaxID=2918900 RepID=A0AA96LGB8_9BACL|nr:MBL fold metallo-hydrolase [Paenibacillus aurantius]WJH32370.1 MBL fold metallo-hydrolase [Paenibacillus sp. CC-CFT747]WNQ12765.1 MBL fold metallo-hydrolase [Paenibacillus aurantius]